MEIGVKKSKIYCWGILALFFVFYLWMVNQIPYTHDDWEWGISDGIHQLLHANLNGRYMGNLFVVVMTRYEIAKNVLMGLCCFFLPLLCTKQALRILKNDSKNNVLIFIVCNCVFLSMDTGVWRQTYGWVSGFANFVISAVFFFVWIDEIYGVSMLESGKKISSSVGRTAFCFVMSVLTQLFLENLAIYCVCLAVFICILYYVKQKKVPIHNLLMAVGAILGLIITFSSGIYKELFGSGFAVGGYRKITMLTGLTRGEIVHKTIMQCAALATGGLTNNTIICLIIIGALSCLHKQVEHTAKCRFKAQNCLIAALLLLYKILLPHLDASCSMVLGAVISIIFFVTVILEVIFLYKKKKEMLSFLLIIWISVPVMLAPLIVTSESGPRLYFTTNVLCILFFAILFADAMKLYGEKKRGKIGMVCAIIAALLLLFRGVKYYEIGKVACERDRIITAAIETDAREIRLPAFPNKECLWLPDPLEEIRLVDFKLFYGLDTSVEIIFEK